MSEAKEIVMEDYELIASAEYIPWQKLKEKTILITGATGLIGQNIVNALMYVNSKRDLNLKIVAVVRDMLKAEQLFEQNANFVMIKSSVELLSLEEVKIDYIIHGANPTASSEFIHHPVETIKTAVLGTMNMLEIAKKNCVSGFAFLSTMEVYGHPQKGHQVSEAEVAGFDPTMIRNSYPMSKQLCEAMCCSYASEYHVPAMSIRLTQTFGPGVAYHDGRVFAEFMRCAVEKRDIVLKTKGETERCYLYTADAVLAILAVLLNGMPGECYTAANNQTYCSIADMAKLVADEIADGKIGLTFDLQDAAQTGYADTLFMNLDTSKLERLGWKANTDLKSMFLRMIKSQ